MRLLFLIGLLSLIDMWLREDQKANILKTDRITSSNIDNYFTLNSEHSWEDLCMHSRFQQTCTPNKVEVWFSIQVLLCKSNQWRLENMKDKPNNNNIFYTIHLSYCTMLIEVAFMVCVIATRAICHLLELSPSPCKIIYMSVDE